MKLLQVLSAIAVVALCTIIGLIGVVTQEATVNAFAADPPELLPEPIDFSSVHDEWLRSRSGGVSIYEFAKKYKGKIVSFDCTIHESWPSVDGNPSYGILPTPESDPNRTHALYLREILKIRDRGESVFVKRARISHVSPLCIIFDEGETVTRLRSPASPGPDSRPDPLPHTSSGWSVRETADPWPTNVAEGPPLPVPQPPIIEQGVEVSAAELKQLSEQPK